MTIALLPFLLVAADGRLAEMVAKSQPVFDSSECRAIRQSVAECVPLFDGEEIAVWATGGVSVVRGLGLAPTADLLRLKDVLILDSPKSVPLLPSRVLTPLRPNV